MLYSICMAIFFANNQLSLPSVSTMGSLFTMACLPAIRITPKARVTVTTIGSPSGMAATARLWGGGEGGRREGVEGGGESVRRK